MRLVNIATITSALTLAALASGCASTGNTTAQRSKRSSKARIEVGAIDDFSLTDQTTEDTTYFLSAVDDGVSAPLPPFAFSSSDAADDPIDAMFPAEPGTVDDAIGEKPKSAVRVYTVAADNAVVRARPDASAAVITVLEKGQRLVGLTAGRWARIAKGQFVDVSTLTPVTSGQQQQSRLGAKEK
jgi:hypothetical protein